MHVVAETAPDVVVMDIQMPRLDGIEATRIITGRQPGVRVVMLTMNEDDETVLSAMRAGASRLPAQGLGRRRGADRDPCRRAGGMVFGATLAARVATYFAGRADEGRGAGALPRPHRPRARRAAAARRRPVERRDRRELFVSNKTVRNAVSGIYAKLHAAGRAEAIITAREAGYGRD